MAITFHPKPGAIFVCDYDTGFISPEMVKRRLCVVITPRLRHREKLCSVVPLSTTHPGNVESYHFEVAFDPELPKPWEGKTKWAKCDMIATVSHDRLSPIGVGRDKTTGKRRYIYPHLAADDILSVRKGVLHALDMGGLTAHL